MPVHKDFGLVLDVFDDADALRRHAPRRLGHRAHPVLDVGELDEPGQHPAVRRRTTRRATSRWRTTATSPTPARSANGSSPRARCSTRRRTRELILHLVAQSEEAGAVPTASSTRCTSAAGAFSLVILTDDALIAVRDPNGFRPLALGRLPPQPDREQPGLMRRLRDVRLRHRRRRVRARHRARRDPRHRPRGRRALSQRRTATSTASACPAPTASASASSSTSTSPAPTPRSSARWWTRCAARWASDSPTTRPSRRWKKGEANGPS